MNMRTSIAKFGILLQMLEITRVKTHSMLQKLQSAFALIIQRSFPPFTFVFVRFITAITKGKRF